MSKTHTKEPTLARLREATKNAALRVGLDIRRASPLDSAAARRRRLLDDHDVDTVVDVGASYGYYALALRASGYERSIVSFEPLHAAFNALSAKAQRDASWRCHRIAIGDESREIDLNVAANSVMSSLLDHTEALGRFHPEAIAVSRETVQLARLDDLASTMFPDGSSFFLKLDVQGYELPALDGAHSFLDRCVGLEVEISLQELYDGQARASEILQRLESKNWHCVGIDPVFVDAETGFVLQADALFARPDYIAARLRVDRTTRSIRA